MKTVLANGTTIYISVHRWSKYDEVPCLRAQVGFESTFSNSKSNPWATRGYSPAPIRNQEVSHWTHLIVFCAEAWNLKHERDSHIHLKRKSQKGFKIDQIELVLKGPQNVAIFRLVRFLTRLPL